MKEEWRAIEEAPEYLVSNKGRVKQRKTGRILKTHLRNGHPRVNLVYNGKHFNQFIYRLVAIAFVGGRRDNLKVIPKDGDKTNLCYENLEWVPLSERTKKKRRSWEVGKDGKLIERTIE